MVSGEEIFSVMQACVLLSWYFYHEGRWVEVWIFAAFQTRVAIPLRLNYPGTFSTCGNHPQGAYLAPPKNLRELECRRRTWWMTIIFDRIASVAGWIHAIDERDIGTELPLRMEDFESDVSVESCDKIRFDHLFLGACSKQHTRHFDHRSFYLSSASVHRPVFTPSQSRNAVWSSY